MVAGTYQPGPDTTGVLPGTTLTPYNTGGGTLTLTTANQVFQDLEIYGDIKVQAAGIKFINCRFHGGLGWPSSVSCVIDCRNSICATNPPEIIDCTVSPDRPSYNRDCIMGSFIAKRCDLSGGCDGLGIYNTSTSQGANVLAEGNWIHDLVYWHPSPAHTDGTHNDCIQIQSGGTITIRGNYLDASCHPGDDSAYPDPDGPDFPGGTLVINNPEKPDLFTQPNGPHANGQAIIVQRNTGVALSNTVIVEKNWLSRGLTGANLKDGNYIFRDNWVIRNSFYLYTASPSSHYPIRPTSAAIGATITGLYTTNKYTDNGEVLTEANGGIKY